MDERDELHAIHKTINYAIDDINKKIKEAQDERDTKKDNTDAHSYWCGIILGYSIALNILETRLEENDIVIRKTK